ncbi:MAG TPA: flagellar biosynthesis protein FlhB [Planctomycetes bacterium]|nr:flagellar biosynthesis protein FlhB [Planctomycetota bacterium]
MKDEDPKRPRRAVALRYDGSVDRAPSLLAKGRGEVADRIQAVARRHGVPVREDSDLVQLLSLCDIGDEIPEELFGAVAELLAYLYHLNRGVD